MEKIEIEPSEELAYWTGVVQSDGHCVRRGKYEKKSISLSFGIEKHSLPMLIKFHEISEDLLKDSLKSCPPHEIKGGGWKYWLGITKIFRQLSDLGIKLFNYCFTFIYFFNNF